MSDTEDVNIPPVVSERLAAWRKHWWWSAFMHYSMGVTGVTASAIAATGSDKYSQSAAVVAAVCIAFLGFVQPERRYLKFVRAWRRLDSSVLHFQFGKIGHDELIEAVEEGESILTEIEIETRRSPDTEKQSNSD